MGFGQHVCAETEGALDQARLAKVSRMGLNIADGARAECTNYFKALHRPVGRLHLRHGESAMSATEPYAPGNSDIMERAAAFSGREWVFERIHDWLKNPAG